jgi:Zn-dependent M28 family amino/carboxypeptidase
MNDNGSGVAAVLEAASALAAASQSSDCGRPLNSVVFVLFDLEEAGGQGSLAFIRG